MIVFVNVCAIFVSKYFKSNIGCLLSQNGVFFFKQKTAYEITV